jgi:hypothetical protein
MNHRPNAKAIAALLAALLDFCQGDERGVMEDAQPANAGSAGGEAWPAGITSETVSEMQSSGS